nr:recombinase zinc beta ribbon domain-containing protein [Paraburkholderia mimosarum]
MLHHPRYTGAFCFGRTRTRKLPDGKQVWQALPVEEWTALIRDAHEGYITWEQFEEYVRILHDNAQAHGSERDLGAPREGPALLQGLAICGRCGDRMTIRYHVHDTRRVPDYMCQSRSINEAIGRPCQQINGAELDQAIGRLLVETVTPVTLQVALAVQKELEQRSGEFDRLRRQEIERANYEVELARRRYLRVDPDNRLVADSLEAEWNHALRTLGAAQERYEKQCGTASAQLDEKQRESIMALAQDFPRLWNDPQTPERKRSVWPVC